MIWLGVVVREECATLSACGWLVISRLLEIPGHILQHSHSRQQKDAPAHKQPLTADIPRHSCQLLYVASHILWMHEISSTAVLTKGDEADLIPKLEKDSCNGRPSTGLSASPPHASVIHQTTPLLHRPRWLGKSARGCSFGKVSILRCVLAFRRSDLAVYLSLHVWMMADALVSS